MSVVKLVPAATKPFAPCSTCAFFTPDTQAFGYQTGWLWFDDKNKPSASAMRFAICSAQGGQFAEVTRRSCNGDWHKPLAKSPDTSDI